MSPTSLGLIAPLGRDEDLGVVKALVADGVIESVWARDLPMVGVGDDDAGQRSDPWWYLGRLRGAGVHPPHVGTASIILGTRNPWVIARAAAGAQVDTGGRFILGVGTGGKAEMNAALGLNGRSLSNFATDWALLRSALRGTQGERLTLGLPSGYGPPPVHLATSDVDRWRAIDGDADGWQTFLTADHGKFEADHARVCTIRGADTDVDLRLDVHLVRPEHGPRQPEFTNPARGRVRCSAAQLPELLKPWVGDPIRRILLRLVGHAPEAAIQDLGQHWT